MLYDDVKEDVLFWSDAGVFPINVTTLDSGISYMSGTLKFIYDEKTDLITLKGLLYQHFEWTGKLVDFCKEYNLWLSSNSKN